jgi:hypothetical protein
VTRCFVRKGDTWFVLRPLAPKALARRTVLPAPAFVYPSIARLHTVFAMYAQVILYLRTNSTIPLRVFDVWVIVTQ